MGQLDGKVAWITGGGTGIGEAGAKAMAADGATVILSGRREGPLAVVAETITAPVYDRGLGHSTRITMYIARTSRFL